MITTKSLIHDLTQLGMQAGHTILVGTSMKAIGADNFTGIGAAFERGTNEVIIGKLAEATVRLMRQRPLVDYAIRWLETQPTEV